MTNPEESYSGQQIGAAWAMIAHGSDARFIPLATAAASPFRFRLLGFSRNESGISPTYCRAGRYRTFCRLVLSAAKPNVNRRSVYVRYTLFE